MIIIKTFALAVLLATVGMTVSYADETKTPGACRADVQKFCADVKPGGGAIVQCMQQHQADLSDACKQNIAIGRENMKAKRQAIRAACKDDAQKFCADVKPGQGRIIMCLKAHQSTVSSLCQSQLEGMKAPMAAAGQPAPSTTAPASADDDGSDQQ